MTEKIHTTDDLFKQINDRLAIIGETPDAYFLCQCVDILKQQGQTIDTQAEKITELESQVEALRKDAERYQWLRDEKNWNEDGITPIIGNGEDTIYGEALDNAIDTAIAKDTQLDALGEMVKLSQEMGLYEQPLSK